MRIGINKGRVKGRVTAPSSKSMTHRMLLCSAMAKGRSRIMNPLISDDTEATKRVLGQIGVEIIEKPKFWEVEGGTLKKPVSELNCKESGTTLRFMTALCSLVNGSCKLTGGPSLSNRPIEPLLGGLKQIGVDCESTGGYPPVSVKGVGVLNGGEIEIPGNISSQFVSALLLVTPLAKHPSTIRLSSSLESKPYVTMTMDAQRLFDVTVEASQDMTFYNIEPHSYKPSHTAVEGDWSSASYLLAAGALTGNVSVDNLNFSSSQGDRRIIEILEKMGASVEIRGDTVKVEKSSLKNVELDLADTPDLFPMVASLCAASSGQSRLSGLRRLRYKESDRLVAVVEGLNNMKVKNWRERGALVIEGGSPEGSMIDPKKDHRIAMALAILGLVAEGETTILDAESVSKSYPQFWNDLEKLGVELRRNNNG